MGAGEGWRSAPEGLPSRRRFTALTESLPSCDSGHPMTHNGSALPPHGRWERGVTAGRLSRTGRSCGQPGRAALACAARCSGGPGPIPPRDAEASGFHGAAVPPPASARRPGAAPSEGSGPRWGGMSGLVCAFSSRPGRGSRGHRGKDRWISRHRHPAGAFDAPWGASTAPPNSSASRPTPELREGRGSHFTRAVRCAAGSLASTSFWRRRSPSGSGCGLRSRSRRSRSYRLRPRLRDAGAGDNGDASGRNVIPSLLPPRAC